MGFVIPYADYESLFTQRLESNKEENTKLHEYVKENKNMADYFPGTIEFPKWALDIPDVRNEVYKTFGNSESDWKLTYQYEENNGIVYFLDDQASYGHFEELEYILETNSVPYDTWSGAYCEFNAEIIGQTFPGDELDAIKTDILSFAERKCCSLKIVVGHKKTACFPL